MAIKRNESLKPISREHHHGLLLSWKIRTGLKKQVAPDRIRKYVNWFFETHLVPHFEIEEQYIFPIIGNDHELVKKALSDHRRLTRLCKSKTDVLKNLNLVEEELEAHIRFEERILFNEIQLIATEAQLKLIAESHNETKFIDNSTDMFWV